MKFTVKLKPTRDDDTEIAKHVELVAEAHVQGGGGAMAVKAIDLPGEPVAQLGVKSAVLGVR